MSQQASSSASGSAASSPSFQIPLIKLTPPKEAPAYTEDVPEQDLGKHSLYVPLRTEEIGWEEGGIYWAGRYTYPVVGIYRGEDDHLAGEYRGGPEPYGFVHMWESEAEEEEEVADEDAEDEMGLHDRESPIFSRRGSDSNGTDISTPEPGTPAELAQNEQGVKITVDEDLMCDRLDAVLRTLADGKGSYDDGNAASIADKSSTLLAPPSEPLAAAVQRPKPTHTRQRSQDSNDASNSAAAALAASAQTERENEQKQLLELPRPSSAVHPSLTRSMHGGDLRRSSDEYTTIWLGEQ